MIEFKGIHSITDPLFQKVYNLSTLAFPSHERRSWDSLEYILAYKKCFYLQAVLQDGEFVGMCNYWQWPQCCFVEHFAIMPSRRNLGLGAEVLTVFMTEHALPILVEVEYPVHEDSQRRIEFYKRQGYAQLAKAYAQPPYEAEGDFTPMLLMSNQPDYVIANFEAIVKLLYTEVYGCSANNSL